MARVGPAVRMLYPGISNQQMAESLADALVLHISRQAESIINDWFNNYSHKAVVTLLQLNKPRHWSGGGWAGRCPNVTRSMRGEITPLERGGPPGQMPTWLPPGQAPGNVGNRARDEGLGRGFGEPSPGSQDRPTYLEFPMVKGSIQTLVQVGYFFHSPKVKNPLQNRARSAFLDSSLAYCKAEYLRSTCSFLVASSQGSLSGGRVR